MSKWINVNKKLPKINEKVLCKVRYHRYGKISHHEILESKFLGMNEIINMPMFDINKYEDEAYTEVTAWKPCK